MKNTLILLAAVISLSYSCNNKSVEKEEEINTKTFESIEKYNSLTSNMSKEEKDTLLTELASFIIRKPSAATWETKFHPEFREYYKKNRSELELVYLATVADTFYYYLLREARTNEGIKKRGVGGKYVINSTDNSIKDFEEIFVSRVLPESDLKEFGNEYMELVTTYSDLTGFLSQKEKIEWPDGRLFYSKQKKEWRYVE